MRPAGKARRGKMLAVCDRGATQPGWMQRRSNAAGLSPRAARGSFVTSVVLVAGALLLVADPPTGAGAQTTADEVVANAASRAAVSAALAYVDSHRESTTAFHAEIAAIISPSGQERDRARVVAARMRQIGLTSVTIDETPNAVGVIPGRSGRALVFISTLDDLATVAEHQRVVQRERRRRQRQRGDWPGRLSRRRAGRSQGMGRHSRYAARGGARRAAGCDRRGRRDVECRIESADPDSGGGTP